LVGLIWNKESLLLPPDERLQYSGLRNPLFWWIILNAAVLYFFFKYP
jgi:SSS family solute:Na+ symporter